MVYAVQCLCNGRVSVRPSVCPVDSSRLPTHFCSSERSSAAARALAADPNVDQYLQVPWPQMQTVA